MFMALEFLIHWILPFLESISKMTIIHLNSIISQRCSTIFDIYIACVMRQIKKIPFFFANGPSITVYENVALHTQNDAKPNIFTKNLWKTLFLNCEISFLLVLLWIVCFSYPANFENIISITIFVEKFAFHTHSQFLFGLSLECTTLFCIQCHRMPYAADTSWAFRL